MKCLSLALAVVACLIAPTSQSMADEGAVVVGRWLKKLRSGSFVQIDLENGNLCLTAGRVEGKRLIGVGLVFHDANNSVECMGNADEAEMMVDLKRQTMYVRFTRVHYFDANCDAIFRDRVWSLSLAAKPR